MNTYMCEKTYVSSLVGSKNQSFPIQLVFGAVTLLLKHIVLLTQNKTFAQI